MILTGFTRLRMVNEREVSGGIMKSSTGPVPCYRGIPFASKSATMV